MLASIIRHLSLLLLSIAFCSAQISTQSAFGFFGAGNAQWQFAHCLDGSGSGNIFFTGSTDGTLLGQNAALGGGQDMFVGRYNRQNGYLTPNANNPTLRFLLTPQEDVGIACDSDTDGSVYVVGHTSGTMAQAPLGRDTIIAKYDNQMNRVWLVQYDFSGSSQDDRPVKIILYGNILYVVGTTSTLGYMARIDPSNGQRLNTVRIGVNYQNAIRNAAIDPTTGNLIVVGVYYSSPLPGGFNTSGGAVPALPVYGNTDAFVASYTSTLTLNWQSSLSAGGYDSAMGVAVDLLGNVYVGGTVTGSIFGATYSPNSNNANLPYVANFDVRGNNLWTNIIPRTDGRGMRHLVLDNLGAVYGVTSSINCLPYSSVDIPFPASSCNSAWQPLDLAKFDSNGALQSYTSSWSQGITHAMTLDNTGLVVLSGTIGGGNLHGLVPPANTWPGFVDTQQLNYNCSCSNLAGLVQQMSDLLNIVPA